MFQNIISVSFYICYSINNLEMADSELHMVIKILSFTERNPVWGGITLPTSTEYTTQQTSYINPTLHDITAKTY